jgi:hypothetical protein
MSQFDIAFMLLIAGLGVGWRLNVFAMIPLAVVAIAGVYIYGIYSDDSILVSAIHAIEGLVIFEAAYLFGAMLAEARRRLPTSETLKLGNENHKV